MGFGRRGLMDQEVEEGTGWELILSAAEGALQIVLTHAEELICAQRWGRNDRATEILAPALADMARTCGLRPRQLRRIACVRGPGSFTGIRLVLVTAAALRRTAPALQLAGLDYLQALATTAAVERRLPYATPITVLTHARRHLLHVQPYISYGWSIPAQAADAVRLCTPEEVLARFMTDNSHTVFCGSGLQRNPRLLEELAKRPDPLCLDQLRLPSVDALRLLARHGEYGHIDIEPLYIRPCDAVETLPRLAQRMGIDAGEAQEELQRLLQRTPSSLE